MMLYMIVYDVCCFVLWVMLIDGCYMYFWLDCGMGYVLFGCGDEWCLCEFVIDVCGVLGGLIDVWKG